MDVNFDQGKHNERPLEGWENAEYRQMMRTRQHHTWLGWATLTFLKVLGLVFATMAAGYGFVKKLWGEL